MATLFLILFFISFAWLVAGLVKPQLVLRFLKGDKTRKEVLLVFGTLSVLFFIFCGLFADSQLPLEKYFTQKDKNISEPLSGSEEQQTSDEQKLKTEAHSNGEKEEKLEEQEAFEREKPKTEVYAVSIGEVAKTDLLQLTPWTDGIVSMNLPAGWDVYTGGECATRSILARDSSSALKQAFYFSEAGPVYANQESKQRDQDYIAMGGIKVPWFESPMVNPLTAENFLINFGALAQMPFFQQAFSQVPIMTNIKIVNTEEISNRPYYITDAKLIRAEFQQNNKLGEGYFYIITVNIEVGLGYNLGYGMMLIGITAPKGLLDLIAPSLKKSLESYTISQEYITACINANNKAVAGILEAGNTLSESSDTIMDAWDNKLESEQRMSEKYSDAILGTSRLYNSNTDEVYEVTPEFYNYYETHNNEFEMNYLENLPDDKWGYAPLNGGKYIK